MKGVNTDNGYLRPKKGFWVCCCENVAEPSPPCCEADGFLFKSSPFKSQRVTHHAMLWWGKWANGTSVACGNRTNTEVKHWQESSKDTTDEEPLHGDKDASSSLITSALRKRHCQSHRSSAGWSSKSRRLRINAWKPRSCPTITRMDSETWIRLQISLKNHLSLCWLGLWRPSLHSNNKQSNSDFTGLLHCD